MNIPGADAKRLADALKAAFRDKTALDQDVLYRFNKNLDDFAGDGSYPSRLWTMVQQVASESWILELIDAAILARPRDIQFPVIRLAIAGPGPAPGAPAADHIEALRLIGDHFLVNRKELRAKLRDLLQPMGKRILCVRDAKPPAPGTRTGKSHTARLITFLAERRGDFEVTQCNLFRLAQALPSGSLVSPADIALALLRPLDLAATVPAAPPRPQASATQAAGETQWPSWTLEFCGNLRARSRGRQKPLWLVIDSFNAVPLPIETLDFVRAIADAIDQGWPELRLVLLGYDQTFTSGVEAIVHKEELQPITVPEISAFLAAVYKERSQAVAPAQVADDTVQVVQRAGSCEAPDFLERLARALAEVLCAGPALPEAAGGSP